MGTISFVDWASRFTNEEYSLMWHRMHAIQWIGPNIQRRFDIAIAGNLVDMADPIMPLFQQALVDEHVLSPARAEMIFTGFPPQISGTNATIAADFVKNQYWAAGTSQANFAAWLTAIGGTFSRASAATYIDGGVVKTAAANVPRLGSNGLRLTGAATNLVWPSIPDDTIAGATPWGVDASSSITLNAGTAPDGTTTASLLDFGGVTAGANGSMIWSNGEGTASATAVTTVSVFVKAGTGRYFVLSNENDVTTWQAAVFDLQTGQFTSSANGSGSTLTAHSITPLSDGWFLVSLTGVLGTAITGPWLVFYAVSVPNPTFSSDGYPDNNAAVSFYAWGAQATQTAFQCDLIPTTTAAATRAADNFDWPFTQRTFSGLVGVNGIVFDGTAAQRILGDNNNAGIYIPAAIQLSAYNGAVSLAGPTITDVSNPHKVMVAGNASNTWVTSDGLTSTTSAIAVNAAAPMTLALGSQGGTANFAGGNYAQFALWNGLVASAADMQRLTA